MGNLNDKVKGKRGLIFLFMILFLPVGRNIGIIVSYSNPKITAAMTGFVTGLFAALFCLVGIGFGYFLATQINNLKLSRVKRIPVKLIAGLLGVMCYFVMMGLTTHA